MELSPMYNADTPLANAIGAHLYRKTASFHTPGHKGRAPVLKSLSTLSADLTELPDTGSLYDGGDAIEQSERRAASAFGAANTCGVDVGVKVSPAGSKSTFTPACSNACPCCS